MVRLLDELKIQRAHIVDYSMGGNVVAQLLTLHPEREADPSVQATRNGVAACIALDNPRGRV